MRKWFLLACIALLALAVFAGAAEGSPAAAHEEKGEAEMTMRMCINDTPVEVAWEDNASVAALRELAAEGLTIEMSMYGGFEQVGPIGQRLPREDVQTTTASGDVVLYSGSQLVVFYGSNDWAYTRLGKITDRTPEEMRALLGHGDVTITLTMAPAETDNPGAEQGTPAAAQ